jgi:hypothetical protein
LGFDGFSNALRNYRVLIYRAETDSDYDVEYEPAPDTDTAPATTDESLLSEEASQIMARTTDFNSKAPY